MRNACSFRPKSSSRNARTTLARLAGFSSTIDGVLEVDADRVRVACRRLLDHVRPRRRHVEHAAFESISGSGEVSVMINRSHEAFRGRNGFVAQ